MIRALVFDFGNVVGFFDHNLIIQGLAAHTDVSAASIRAAIIGSQLEDDYEKGRISSADFLKQARDLLRLRCPDETMIGTYCEIFWPNVEVCTLIPRLKSRYRLLLASNTTELHSRHFQRQFAETLRDFDGIVLSHEIGARKPSAAFFERCVESAGCVAQECLFIDDLPANVAGAQAVGMQGIVYTTFAELRTQLAAHGIVVD